jgi:hypothetical protein
MADSGLFLAILAVGLAAVVQVLTDPRITRRFILRSLAAFGVYAAHVSLGLAVVFLLLPQGPGAAAGVTLLLLGWIGLGALGLVRFAPRLREPPAVLARFGIADALCLLAMLCGILAAYGVWPKAG